MVRFLVPLLLGLAACSSSSSDGLSGTSTPGQGAGGQGGGAAGSGQAGGAGTAGAGGTGGPSVGGASSGAGGSAPLCVPGAQVACACPGGAPGAQACRPDGGGYEMCICPGAGGAAGGGGSASGGDGGASGTDGAGGSVGSAGDGGSGWAGSGGVAGKDGGAGAGGSLPNGCGTGWCGSHMTNDGQPLECGGCADGEVCPGGSSTSCCKPHPNCAADQCGSVSDFCGSMVQCPKKCTQSQLCTLATPNAAHTSCVEDCTYDGIHNKDCEKEFGAALVWVYSFTCLSDASAMSMNPGACKPLPGKPRTFCCLSK